MALVTWTSWKNGLWTAGPPIKIPANYLTRLTNMQVMDEGTIKTRYGCSSFLALADTVDSQYIANQHFYKLSTGAVYKDAVSLGFTQTGRWLRACGLTTYGLPSDIVFFPMENTMRKYYSATVYNWGVWDPAVPNVGLVPPTPTAVDAGVAGNLSGNYYYKVGYYNSTTKTLSELSASSTVCTVTSKQVTVGNLPLTCNDPQIDQIAIYRTFGLISGAWYFVDFVALGTATYTDNTLDAGLGDLVSNFLITTPTVSIAGKYKSRLMLADARDNPRYGYLSTASYPEQYGFDMYEMVCDSGDTIVGVVEYGDYCYLFGKQSVYVVQLSSASTSKTTTTATSTTTATTSTSTTTTYTIYTAKVMGGRGCVNGNTICLTKSGIYFLSDDGVYLLSGVSAATKKSENIDALFRGIDRGGLSLCSDTTTYSAVYVGSRYYLTYYGDDAVWHTVVYNELKGRWKHTTGWKWVAEPTTGSYPIVGLTSAVGLFGPGNTTDVGGTWTSECGFALDATPTLLKDIRRFRFSCACAGTVTVSFYDDTTLVYSVDVVAPTKLTAWTKYSLPVGSYFMLPEVRFSSTSAFELYMFEVDMYPVRQTDSDYTRFNTNTTAGTTSGDTTTTTTS